MKIVTVIGARPQFVKAASLSREIIQTAQVDEVIVHTGQHFDANMSKIFFDEMNIPKPKYNLNINSLNHGAMTGRMMEQIESILIEESPDWLLVYGDTNSTLAGALAATKLHIKVAHVEAGLRSFNIHMPEEINRILTDRISTVLFCPTNEAMNNLKREGYDSLDKMIYNVGDIMCDSALFFSGRTRKESKDDNNEKYLVATIHRAENTDDEKKLVNIFEALDEINATHEVVLPLHPRTKFFLEKYKIETSITLIDPLGYLEMVSLIKNSCGVITDSGGLQKEAYFFRKRCFTLREQTEWVELVKAGCNQLINVELDNISSIILKNLPISPDFSGKIYGDGNTSKRIIEVLLKNWNNA